MKKNIEKIVKILIYATFFVPLVVLPSSYIFPFIVPKVLLFRSLVELALVGYVLLLIINFQEYRPRFSSINFIVFLFVISFGISTFVGVDPYHSFWDNHERMLGFFTILHYFVFFIILSGLFKDWQEWLMAMRIFLIAGSIVMFIGFLQVFFPNLLLNQGSDRVSSTLGNPIYVGGYGLFLSFLASILFFKEKNNFWKIIACSLGFLSLIVTFFSGTRGSMLGLVAGIGVAVIGYIILLKNYPKTRLGLGILAISVIIIIGLLYNFRKTDFVNNLPAVGRAINTSLTDVKASPRWIAWEISIKSWKEKPVFGWGPNNFFYAFNKNYNPRSLDFGYGETWFDNAHNIIMNTLAVQGGFGLVVYIFIFIFSIASLWQNSDLRKDNYHFLVIASSFLVAHLVQNITVFENPTSYLYFMFWLAMVNKLTMNKEPASSADRQLTNIKTKVEKNVNVGKVDKNLGYGVMGFICIVGLLMIFVFNVQPSRANKMTLKAIRDFNQDPILGLPSVKTALEFSSPHIDDIRSDIARNSFQIISANQQKIDKNKLQEMFQLVYGNLQKNTELHPMDIRNQLTLAQLAQTAYTFDQNIQYIFEAENYLNQALSYSPRRQQIIFSLAAIKAQLNKPGEAVAMLEQTIKDNPRVSEGYWRLAFTYKVMGQDQKAKDILVLAEKNNIVFNEGEKQIIDQIMVQNNNVGTGNLKGNKK